MQVIIQVISSMKHSLLTQIIRDKKIGDFEFEITTLKGAKSQRSITRMVSSGEGRHGIIDMEWDDGLRILLCKISTHEGTFPHLIAGDLIDYLLARFNDTITIINIVSK